MIIFAVNKTIIILCRAGCCEWRVSAVVRWGINWNQRSENPSKENKLNVSGAGGVTDKNKRDVVVPFWCSSHALRMTWQSPGKHLADSIHIQVVSDPVTYRQELFFGVRIRSAEWEKLEVVRCRLLWRKVGKKHLLLLADDRRLIFRLPAFGRMMKKYQLFALLSPISSSSSPSDRGVVSDTHGWLLFTHSDLYHNLFVPHFDDVWKFVYFLLIPFIFLRTPVSLTHDDIEWYHIQLTEFDRHGTTNSVFVAQLRGGREFTHVLDKCRLRLMTNASLTA